ncbi:hypothetical protein [Verrucomicrobium spinosum]|uniref:hypothetical protein n=1 Tax=Verrucomicrobium spinosum TaxID=2736 RepID=UPI000AB7FDA4|nr:hypothetical protein [Verrucomicrobium spinosum]
MSVVPSTAHLLQRRSGSRARWLAMVIIAIGFISQVADGGESSRKEQGDPVRRLWKRVADGRVQLDASSESAFLKSVLRELKVPVASQVLVFSKTSLQRDLISPQQPRAIYYNDECYVGWVKGGAIELIGVHAVEGPQYYLLQRSVAGLEKGPVFQVGKDCFSCHGGAALQVQSVRVDGEGQPLTGSVSFSTTEESPLGERWGGWYVTGHSGKEAHLGNLVAGQHPSRIGTAPETLADLLPAAVYPTDTSDIVSLMVLEHQYSMQNAITETGRAARSLLSRMIPGAEVPLPVATGKRLLQKHADRLVARLLFTEEHELIGGGVQGSAAFQEAFRRSRRSASDGSSLRDFELHTRLFKYRCSYMIYSPSFVALPGEFKKVLFQRLALRLKDQPTDEADWLPNTERAQLRRILTETLGGEDLSLTP